ncbi:peptidase C25 [Fulvitalea axinellae]|uniref:Peptidase C25 n=1 Tax=Fulvitalea axinellae TaxID=1182444 RepID=A0AAU9CGG5_9BACT|nr:peptidase C25 [Fulvitalea axinellae]
MRRYHFLSVILLFATAMMASGQPTAKESVLKDGLWLKIPIQNEGVYKIGKSWLSAAGIDANSLDPRRLAVYGKPSGMLPQENSADREWGLTECAVLVTGQNDASFDDNDALYFYAQSANAVKRRADGFLYRETNLYETTNYYFLTIKDSPGKRINDATDTEDGPILNEYRAFASHEYERMKPVVDSGRNWYGEDFRDTESFTHNFTTPDKIPNSEIQVWAKLLKRTNDEMLANISVNGSLAGTVEVQYHRPCQYCATGAEGEGTFAVSPGGNNISVNVSTQKGIGHIDHISTNYKATAVKHSGELSLHFDAQGGNRTVFVSQAKAGDHVWDITDKGQAEKITYTSTENGIKFPADLSENNTYLVFSESDVTNAPSPATATNQNLLGELSPELVIISHPDFMAQAQRLASMRSAKLNVKVVTPEQVYNEFSAGKQDPTAIRDYMRYLYEAGGQKLKYLLLFGKASYDYRNLKDAGKHFVPTYESRNSVHPVFSYSSDDYFGILGPDEGDWIEDYNDDEDMEIAVGRIPVATLEQAKSLVDKLEKYPNQTGEWRRRVAIIADDGDGGIHMAAAEKVEDIVNQEAPDLKVEKLYIDAFEQITGQSEIVAPNANKRLDELVNEGCFLIDYIGHGREDILAHERILTEEQIQSWKNPDYPAIFATATCQFGRHDNPSVTSGAEKILFRENGGGIALITTSRPVYSDGNEEINKALFQALAQAQNGATLGDIFKRTKNEALFGPKNRNFILLGDPSMELFPDYAEVAIDEINGIPNGQDIELGAMSAVNVKGHINQSGTLASGFSGTLRVEVLDKPVTAKTKGDENQPFQYRKENVIFRGTASVKDGRFESDFIVPKNIDYRIEKGTMRFFAENETGKEAKGAFREFKIGGTSENPVSDNNPPTIEVFLNDRNFKAGDYVFPDADILAYLSDENGISISRANVGQEMSIILDDTVTIPATPYYTANLDTHQSGMLRYPSKGLKKGPHSLKIRAWDNLNNFSEVETHFFVSDRPSLKLENVTVFPNPIQDYGQIRFNHNREDDDFTILVRLMNLTGQTVFSKNVDYPETNGDTAEFDWLSSAEETTALPGPGLYILRLSVSSKLDGSTAKYSTRVLLIKR